MNSSEKTVILEPSHSQSELDRIKELRDLEILDTDAEDVFDNFVFLAREACQAPIASISLVDVERTWFKAKAGFFDSEARRCDTFCSAVVQTASPLFVEDASVHPDFKNIVYVQKADGIRSYAGIPLITSRGFAVGVLCVIDIVPRTFTQLQIECLTRLASQVVYVLQQRRATILLTELERVRAVSEQRLNFALDSAEIGDWSMDLRTNVVTRSVQHARCFGYEDAEAKWGYDVFLSHVDTTDRDRVDGVFKAALAEKGIYDVVFKAVWPDGSTHWLWSRGRFYFDNADVPIRVAGVVGDVSARVLAEQELNASNRRYQLLFENDKSAILQTTADGRIMFANPAACTLFGMTEEELRQSGRSKLVKTSDPRLADLLAKRAVNGYASGQLTMIRGNGSEFEADISSTLYNDKEGVERTSLIVSDISERVKLLQIEREQHVRLSEMEAHHRRLLHHLSSGIVVHDPETRIIFCNARASELLGLSADQLDGKVAIDPDWQFVYEDGLVIPPTEYPVNQVIASLVPMKELILGVRRPDRVDLVWLLVHAFPEFDDRGGLKQVVVNFHDVTQRKNAESRTWTEANFDHLTRLPNRRLFYDRLEQTLRQSQRDSSIAAVMFLDLDHFKNVNDSRGHDVGDKLLVEVAHRIGECVRESDTLARLGGDEFTVILTDLQHDHDVGQVAAKIINAISQPLSLGGFESFISASVGIAVFPDDGTTSTELLKHADQALYVAKNDGRGCFRFFTASMQESAEEKMQLTSDLRSALRDRQFELFYQPILDIGSGTVSKAEALIRWRHPTRGLVSPGLFIPLAEEAGLIHEIGNWVFHAAVDEVARISKKIPGFQISINTSPVQFSSDDDLHNDWIAHLNRLGLPGSSIVMEITEGLLLKSNPAVSTKLLKFRDAGIQVAIDDFGTGYSSLAYLKKFDIDYLKIDQSFVRNLAPNSPDYAVCEAIIVMAHKLGLMVVAEGVETQEQLDLLRLIGCDFSQGYLFARPMPVNEFEKFLFGDKHEDSNTAPK